MKYRIEWTAQQDTDYRHTASTMYVADGFVIWKGKKDCGHSLYSANEWHLIRTADNMEIHYGKTAKECKGALEYCIIKGKDINNIDTAMVGFGAKFNHDFSDWHF